MKVGVAYSKPDGQAWLQVELPEGATVQQAIEQSGILKRFPDIDLDTQKVGIYGKFCKLDNLVQEGDRVEIYRPITVDLSDGDDDDDDD
ncbi:RnfH family protein [Ectothiorhodospira lacustris]|uniref:RnfH family protein n=1 Tax=Ectothiorhodospira lacustris TaxID=2899127 RepID=UPI001EE946EA|nr:RnfH family protein [Ectothiorhodospira lacustris]MCG5500289.1 RnfH family protein [Ectothiorhodospira lacustris]MCG5511146.1 RnfH family protein [Ectothiorhodospira lacustris]MCG5522810.1 RnfH family protein [Ectothiorhodospira lacustris]